VPPEASRWTLRGTWRLIVKELSAFGVVGAVCLVLDLGLFQVLYAEFGVDAVLAKLIAAVVSTTAAFLGHRFWSFSHRTHTQLHRDYVRFALVNVGTLVLSLAIVAFVRHPLGQENALVLQVANIVSIGIGTVIRFLVYRAWVFPAPAEQEPAAAVSA
jgi:putative flippase GtrA